MTRMYVANASLQRHLFTYRIPEQTKERTVPIESMSQSVLPDDLTTEDVSAIVEQHSQYGFPSLDGLKSVRLGSRVTLVYSLGKPVPSIAIDTLFQMNKGLLDEFGRRIRQETAVASNLAVNNALDDMRQQGLSADIKGFQMSVVEEEPAGGYTTPNPISEGYEVSDPSSSSNAANPPRASRGRRK